MNVVSRCVDTQVGHTFDRRQTLALLPHLVEHRVALAERMGATGFAEATLERFIRCREEQDRGRRILLEVLDELRKSAQVGAFTNVYDEGGSRDVLGTLAQLDELRDEFYRQVVDRVVVEIFKDAQRRTLA